MTLYKTLNRTHKSADAPSPRFGPSQNLDYELELGAFVGPGNPAGRRVPIAGPAAHLFGVVLLNGWSARDLQAWEYPPLGPFLAKNFATSISPWIVTMEALAPFRVPAFSRPATDPAPLAYLADPHAATQPVSISPSKHGCSRPRAPAPGASASANAAASCCPPPTDGAPAPSVGH